MVAYCFQKIPQKGSPWSFLCSKVTCSLSCPKSTVLELKSLPALPLVFLCNVCLCLLPYGILQSTAVIWIYYNPVFIWLSKLSKNLYLSSNFDFSVGHERKPMLDCIHPVHCLIFFFAQGLLYKKVSIFLNSITPYMTLMFSFIYLTYWIYISHELNRLHYSWI